MFAEISGRGGGVAREAESPYHVVQRHIILDDYPALVGHSFKPDLDLVFLLLPSVLSLRATVTLPEGGSDGELGGGQGAGPSPPPTDGAPRPPQ